MQLFCVLYLSCSFLNGLLGMVRVCFWEDRQFALVVWEQRQASFGISQVSNKGVGAMVEETLKSPFMRQRQSSLAGVYLCCFESVVGEEQDDYQRFLEALRDLQVRLAILGVLVSPSGLQSLLYSVIINLVLFFDWSLFYIQLFIFFIFIFFVMYVHILSFFLMKLGFLLKKKLKKLFFYIRECLGQLAHNLTNLIRPPV